MCDKHKLVVCIMPKSKVKYFGMNAFRENYLGENDLNTIKKTTAKYTNNRAKQIKTT